MFGRLKAAWPLGAVALAAVAMAAWFATPTATAESASVVPDGPTIVHWYDLGGGRSNNETQVDSATPQRVYGLDDPAGSAGVLVEGGPVCIYTTDNSDDPDAGAGGGRNLYKRQGAERSDVGAVIERGWYDRTWVFKGACSDRNIPLCLGFNLCVT